MTRGHSGYGAPRRNQPGQPARGPRVNRFDAPCASCAETVRAGTGTLEGGPGHWVVRHRHQEWSGSPVSGWYVGGCPADTAKLNASGGWGPQSARTFTPSAPTELVWCEAINAPAHGNGPHQLQASCRNPHNAGTYAPSQVDPSDVREASRLAGGKYAYTASGARMIMGSRRCIDAPCCGCCD